ncbi:MAG: chromosomal replication initiator protein DnaA [Neisseria sp.]|nr:chromosomal replication initiator protein DnaA [Neisseria sp.]
MDLAGFWPLCLLRLQQKISAPLFEQWIAPLTVGEENGVWVVYGKNQFFVNMLKSRYAAEIEALREELVPQQAPLLFKVGSGRHYVPAVEDGAGNSAANGIIKVPERVAASKKENGSAADTALFPVVSVSAADEEPGVGRNKKRKTSALDIVSKYVDEASQHRAADGTDKSEVLEPLGKIVLPQDKEQREKGEKRFRQTNLNPAYTFETLAEGKGNQMAAAAAKAIAGRPGGNYNPFFLYGSTGLGKTHLVQAIGNELLRLSPDAKVHYLHAKEYTRAVMSAYQNKSFDSFKQQYLRYDLLMVDDIQFIKGKERTMEEFFYLYNHFHENQKQLILTCDVLPSKIDDMDDRLKSRFSWGLTLELEPPEFEMRVAILQKKAQAAGVKLPPEVADFIAEYVRSNVRELEGAFKQVEARSNFENRPIDIDLARTALANIIAGNYKPITADLIVDIVCRNYSIRPSDLTGKKRTRNIARPRQICMSLMKELTALSYQDIGQFLGGRDHSTVIHGVETVAGLREEVPEIAQDYEKLLKLIQN